jgi:dTDP-4-amino-4,6-dideoxygalactose transaminase
MSRIFLSSPHIGPDERRFVEDAFDSNWIAPLGPHVDAFERELAALVEAGHAAALSSGTAAIHLALKLLGVERGDDVLCSTLTFCASANPIIYEGARPVFIDSASGSFNIDPSLVEEELEERRRRNERQPAALIGVDLYGEPADWDRLREVCDRFDVPVIEDAAEALGATYHGRPVGNFGHLGVFSFNGNKIITTSGGGMLVSDDATLIERARFLATQARDPAPHYQHTQIGYNYRLSNVCAAIGRGQLNVLQDRVDARRAVYARYASALSGVSGLSFLEQPSWAEGNRWLTVVFVDAEVTGTTREDLRHALEEHDIEARPVWKPMHLQPVFRDAPVRRGAVSEALFERGLCLPSGSNMSVDEQQRVIDRLLEAIPSAV